MENYKTTVNHEKYIMHALGGIDKTYSYTNSIDALEKTYNAGYKLFEVDVSFTSDNKLVLAHSDHDDKWSKKDWEERFGLEYNKNKTKCALKEFLSFKIQGKFRTTTFADFLDFMEKHEDMYVMIDGGTRNYKDTKKLYNAIVKEAKGRTSVLNRLIAGGTSTKMITAVREVYNFPILNLYFNTDEKREKSIYNPKDFVKYCKKNGISSFSVSKETYTKEVAEVLDNSGLISYVFTINDEEAEKDVRDIGADIIGTDFLWE